MTPPPMTTMSAVLVCSTCLLLEKYRDWGLSQSPISMLHPRERRFGLGQCLGLLEALESEGFQQFGALASEEAGHLLSDPDHLEAMVGVGDDVYVGAHEVKDREVIRRERAHPSRRLLGREPARALVPLHAMRQRRQPDVVEVVAHAVVGAAPAVGIELAIVAYFLRHRAALH